MSYCLGWSRPAKAANPLYETEKSAHVHITVVKLRPLTRQDTLTQDIIISY